MITPDVNDAQRALLNLPLVSWTGARPWREWLLDSFWSTLWDCPCRAHVWLLPRPHQSTVAGACCGGVKGWEMSCLLVMTEHLRTLVRQNQSRWVTGKFHQVGPAVVAPFFTPLCPAMVGPVATGPTGVQTHHGHLFACGIWNKTLMYFSWWVRCYNIRYMWSAPIFTH